MSEPYKNPGAPTHVITGSAGCFSKHNPFLNQTQIYSAFRSDDYGYSRMKIINTTHLYIEQVSDDQVSFIRNELKENITKTYINRVVK